MPEPRDDDDRRLLESIAKHGWHSIAIEEDEEGPGFGYTIGVPTTWSQPEFLVLGVPTELAFGIFGSLADALKAGHTFTHGDESDQVLEEYPVAFVSVDREHYPEYLGWARWYHGGDDFPVLQCVLPDWGGYFPWEDGCRPSTIRSQPILNREYAERVPALDPDWPFDAPKNLASITTGQVLEQNLPILEVSHYLDGDWVFLTRPSTGPEDGKVVALETLYRRDPSLAEIADLPEGWYAWREAVGAPWEREELPPDEDEEEESEQD